MLFEDFCSQNNIIVQYYEFTTKIRGLCVKRDDYYIVAINPKFCNSSQKKTLIHEVIHIMENHFQHDNVEDCEIEVHNLIHKIRYEFEISEV